MAEIKRHDELQGAIVHVYDGIEEADNQLPLWWLAIFYGAIVFAIGYWFYYEAYAAAPLGRAAYDEQMAAEAAAAPEVTPEQLLAMGEDAEAVAAGRAIFEANCVACHDQMAQGKIGPNLTDAYWIHGGSAMDIHLTITQGYPAKGMPPWGPSLGAEAVNHAVAYILSIRNTNVEGKEAQGELYAPEGAVEDAGVQEPAEVLDGAAAAPADGDDAEHAEPADDAEHAEPADDAEHAEPADDAERADGEPTAEGSGSNEAVEE